MWSLQITWYLLCSVLVLPLLCEDPSEGAGGEEGFLSRVLGLPGVWWPHTHIFSNAWSLLAAGLSSAVVGASFLPKLRRSDVDQATERVFRGVVAQPHSWPWLAKLKVRRPSTPTRRETFLCLDHIPTSRGQSETESLWRSSHSGQICADCQTLRVLGPQWGRGGRQAG